MIYRLVAKIITLFVFSIPLFGGISGSLKVDTEWSGLVIVDGDVVIEPGATLSISPGTRILVLSDFKADPNGTEIIVRGALQADGQPGSGRIVFSALGSTDRLFNWQGIRFINSAPGSLLNNCVIEYAYNGIAIIQSAPEIERCLIRYNYYAGINCDLRANALISRTTIAENGFCGINCELGATPRVEKCRIVANLIGVVIADLSKPDLGNKRIQDGQSPGDNTFMNNIRFDIHNQSRHEISAENNSWVHNSLEELNNRLFDQSDDRRFGPISLSSYKLLPQDNPLTEALALSMSRDYREIPTPDLAQFNSLSRKVPVQDNAGRNDLAPAAADQFERRPLDPVVYPSAQVNPALVSVSKTYRDNLLDNEVKVYVRRARANYPAQYANKSIEGAVIMEVTVATDGSVKEYRIIHSDDELFSQSASAAIRKYRYRPGTIQGTPVIFKTIEQIRFHPNS